MKRSLFVCGALLLSPVASFAIVDTNENGVSDLWEKEFNSGLLFSGSFDPQADDDGDGWTNAQEAAAGTDPLNPNAPDGIVRPDIVRTPAVMGEENGEPVIITPEVLTISWPTVIGKQYTLLVSPDLSQEGWIEVPDSEFIGDGEVHEFNFEMSGEEKCFWRVAVQDVDGDCDLLTDAEEHALGTNPQSSDSDEDGLGDGQEVTVGSNPVNSNSDEDDLADGVDADPTNTLIDWEKTSEGFYALVDIPAPDGQTPRDLNDNGVILFDTGIWKDGAWSNLDPPQMAGSFAREEGDEGTTNYESQAAIWTSFNNNLKLIGSSECNTEFVPDPGSNAGGGESSFYSLVSWSNLDQPQYCEEMAIHLPAYMRNMIGSVHPLGIGADGKKVAIVSYYEDIDPAPETQNLKEHTQLAVFPAGGGEPEFLTPPDDHLLYSTFGAGTMVTSSGWIICPSSKTATPDPNSDPATTFRVDMWKPDNTRVDVSGGFTDHSLQRLNLAELPNGRLGIVGVTGEAADGTVLLEDAGHSMAESPSLSSDGIQVFAGDGSAMTRDNKLWRNGKLTPMRDLCKRIGELLNDGWQLHPLKANKYGTYLIEAEGPNGEKKAKLVVPIRVDGVNATVTPPNLEAPDRGVDNISRVAEDKPDNGHQSSSWIMAPISGANTVRFRSAASSSLKLHLSADHATFSPAFLDSPDQQVTVTGTGTETSESRLVVKVGEDEVDCPIQVKTMKKRNVKVTIHAVGLFAVPPEERQILDLNSIQEYLNSVFMPQINAEILVTQNPENDQLAWDIGKASDYNLSGPGSERIHEGNGYFDFSKADELEKEDKYINLTLEDKNADINVYVLTRHFVGWSQGVPAVMPLTGGVGVTRRARMSS